MIIRNPTDIEVDFEIRGGAVGHMIGKGWLEPGDEDEWEPPGNYDSVRLRFCDDNGDLVELEVDVDAICSLQKRGDSWEIAVE